MGEMQRRFAIVGPGRVGRALGLALAGRGMVPIGVWGRAEPAAGKTEAQADLVGQAEGRTNAKGTGTKAIAPAIGERLARLAAELHSPARTTPSPELKEADWLFLTVPDRELAAVVERFHRSGFVRPDTVWIHTAGVYGVEILPAGRPRLALHPPASISGAPADLEDLTWAVEADGAQASEAAAQIVGLLHGKMVNVPGERRAFYHAATAMAANLSAAVWLLAEEMLAAIGFDREAAHQAVVRLAKSSLTNVERAGAAGITGPVRRGDVETVQRHLQALHLDRDEGWARTCTWNSNRDFGYTSAVLTGRDIAVNPADIYRRLSFLLACELAKAGILTPADVLEWKQLLSMEGPD